MHTFPLQFAFHGALILFLGNCLGFPLARALTARTATPHQKDAWRMAHSANTGFGVFLIAVGGVAPYLVLAPDQQQWLVCLLAASGYGFFVGTLIAAITGHRGLKFKGPLWNWVALACYHIGVIGSMLGVPLLLYGAWQGM